LILEVIIPKDKKSSLDVCQLFTKFIELRYNIDWQLNLNLEKYSFIYLNPN